MMKKIMTLAVAAVSAIVLSIPSHADELRKAVRLYEDGMLVRSRALFNDMAEESRTSDPEGWSVLCDVLMQTVGYEGRMESFIRESQHSVLIPQIRYAHAANLFDKKEYKAASEEFAKIDRKSLYKDQEDEFLFWQAYCDLETMNE